jgi:hypothetical protein
VEPARTFTSIGEAGPRFALVNPRLWFFHPLLNLAWVSFFLFWITLVDYTTGSWEDVMPMVGVFALIWLAGSWWNRRRALDATKNYAELRANSLVIVFGGASFDIPKSNVASWEEEPPSARLRVQIRGSQWLPTARHVRIMLIKPTGYSFKLMSVLGQWRAGSLHLEPRDLNVFEEALDSWLKTAS